MAKFVNLPLFPAYGSIIKEKRLQEDERNAKFIKKSEISSEDFTYSHFISGKKSRRVPDFRQ